MTDFAMEIPKTVLKVRNAFASGITKNVDFRYKQLKSLYRMCIENEERFSNAVREDLGKPEQEAILFEVEFLLNDIRCMLANIRKWVKSVPAEKTFITILDDVYVKSEPYGVALVIGAWNYPIQLSMAPMVGAITAGNCVILKPSELAPKSAELMKELIPKYLDPNCYQVVTGGPAETTVLLKERFDYIFYTGSTTVGRIVREASNKHITPTTLELGGKSPVYVDDSINMEVACKRLLWGKFINAGQTCVAPDYVLCTKQTREKLIPVMRDTIKDFYGENPQKSPDFGRIINNRHFQRLSGLMKNGKIVIGGETDEATKYISPTVIVDIELTDPIMQDEIFGPLFPVITVDDVDEAIDIINSKEKPLTLNIYSRKRDVIKRILDSTSSGSVCVNDSIVNLSVDALPFGGVGYSGMGNYHGKYSFDTFSHQKSVLVRNYSLLGEKLGESRYPPYSEKNKKYLRTLLKKRDGYSPRLDYILFFVVGFSCAFILKLILHFSGVHYF